MTEPFYPDNLVACDLCGCPIPAGLLCADCQWMTEEWAGLSEPDERDEEINDAIP